MADSPMFGLSMRQPPSNLRAEQALLGAILVNNKAYDAVSGFLSRQHFADPVHGAIYIAASERIEGGGVADIVTLKQRLEHSGELEQVGGVKYLAELVTAMVGVVNAKEYGLAIVDCWLRRELVAIGETTVNNAFGADPALDARGVLEQAEAALYALGEGQAHDDRVAMLHEAAGQAIEAAVAASLRSSGLVGLPTGLAALDGLTGGLRAEHLVVLGARPNMGKTTLMMKLAVAAVTPAEDRPKGGRALVISREMTRQGIAAMTVAGLSGLPRDAVVRGRVQSRDDMGRFVWTPINQADVDRMVRTQTMLVDRRIVIDECPSGTVAAIRARARREKRRHGLDAIYIDHLGYLRDPLAARFGNRVQEISAITKGLKALARELGVPVVLLSQLNREVTKRANKRPVMSDLRDAGSIEEDADVVMFLHREHYYLRTQKLSREQGEREDAFAARVSELHEMEIAARGKAEINVEKGREMRTGIVEVKFDDDSVWFSDLPDEAAP